MKCADCREEILQKHPEKCPYCGSTNLISEEDDAQNVIGEIKKLQKAGRHEEAALRYEELAMWDKAEECRRMEKGSHVYSANVKVGRISAISMECPHCGSTQSLSQKFNEVVCERCGKNYVIPKKVLDLL